MDVTLALILIALLQAKHFLADFVFQTGWMVHTKGIYGHPGGLAHSGIHAGLSLPILLFSPASLTLALTLTVAEFLLHYHVDWAKNQITGRLDADPTRHGFWIWFGADQAAHQLTYLGMVAIIAAYT